MMCKFCEIELITLIHQELALYYCKNCRLVYFYDIMPERKKPDLSRELDALLKKYRNRPKPKDEDVLEGLSSLFG